MAAHDGALPGGTYMRCSHQSSDHGSLWRYLSEGMAGLYNLGVIAEFRGRGIARTLALQRISDAIDHGAKTLFIQTEPNGVVETMYHRLGFRTEFVGTCYAKA